MVLDGDVRAHAHELAGEHEPVLEHVLGDDGHAVGERGQQHELRLQVGREARMRQGLNIDGNKGAAYG